MTVIISEDLVLASVQSFDADNPIIGWENLVTVANVSSGNTDSEASVEDPDHPTTNLANTSTNLRFQQAIAGESIYFQVDLDGSRNVDYIALAGHNFGSNQRILQVFGATGLDGDGDPVFYPITQDVIVANNAPILFRFEKAPYVAIRFTMLSTIGNDTLYCAVMYVGELLVLERKIQVAFTPITMGRKSELITNRSERGHFLGRVVVGSWVECAATISHLSPDWYRQYMDPFVEVSDTTPFFFAWAPISYPYEVGYAWTRNNPMPEIHEPSLELFRITLDMQGITE